MLLSWFYTRKRNGFIYSLVSCLQMHLVKRQSMDNTANALSKDKAWIMDHFLFCSNSICHLSLDLQELNDVSCSSDKLMLKKKTVTLLFFLPNHMTSCDP